MAERIDAAAPDGAARFAALVDRPRGDVQDVAATVRRVVEDVRVRGGAALLDYTRRFDRLALDDPSALEIDAEAIRDAVARCDPADLAALDLAAARIRAFHERQMPRDIAYADESGVGLGLRWRPMRAAGVYAPGGKAAYPSSVLMNAIPARVAGCRDVTMCAPTPDGELEPLVLAAAAKAGVDRVFCLGGAQAIAAMACGAGPVPRCDVVVGPGNAYVAEAKRQLFGTVGIDMIAGPSEIVVYAERGAPAPWIAADLLSQAEHDELAQAILITPEPALADAVAREVDIQLDALPRRAIAETSWRDWGAIVVALDREDALAKIDALAPEHLELMVDDPDALAERVANAGAIFLGAHTPEAIGDYVGGPNHVLPTARSARFSSGLGVYDFMKRTTLLKATVAAYGPLADAAERLARAEGLEGHARSCAIRRARAAGDGA